MKRILLLSTFSFIGLVILAQPTIQSSEFYPSIGESFTTYPSDSVFQGPAGNNVTWDLSGQNAYLSYNNNVSATDPSYPAATHKMVQVGGSVIYLDLTTDDYLILALTFGGGSIVYSDPNKMYQFPMTMGTSFTDNAVATIDQFGDITLRTVTTDGEVDGYGTLITPEGTYTDVLRVHLFKTIVDDEQGSISTTTQDIYMWLKAGIYHELANVQITYSDGEAWGTSYYTGANTVGLAENTSETPLVLFPNPAQDIVSLKFDSKIDNIEVFDMNGRSIAVEFNPTNKTIDVSGLNSGIYYVNVYSNNNKSVQKLIKR